MSRVYTYRTFYLCTRCHAPDKVKRVTSICEDCWEEIAAEQGVAVRTAKFRRSLANVANRLGFTPCRKCWKSPPDSVLSGYCVECHQKILATERYRREARYRLGKCTIKGCDNPLYKHYKRCERHHMENIPNLLILRSKYSVQVTPEISKDRWLRYGSDSHMKRYQKAKENGVCYKCGQPRDPVVQWPICTDCKNHRNELRRKRLVLSRKS